MLAECFRWACLSFTRRCALGSERKTRRRTFRRTGHACACRCGMRPGIRLGGEPGARGHRAPASSLRQFACTASRHLAIRQYLRPGRHRMAKQSSQKFIARNRAPRVQIEYDVEVYGAQKKVQVPFVMGVMSDLSGSNNAELPPIEERKALEIDVDNFDNRLQSMKPRVSFAVPNTLTGEGNLNVDITFESMDDFSPAAVARKVGAVAKLLEARTQLANL